MLKFTAVTRIIHFLFAVYEIFVDLRKHRRYTDMEKLTKQEEELMQAIWTAGENNLKAFIEYLPEPRPPYTTLASTVKNLEKKHFVCSRMIGNVYLYKPVISEEVYKQKMMQGFAQNYFNNSYKEMVNFFIEHKKLKPKELHELIKMIEEKK